MHGFFRVKEKHMMKSEPLLMNILKERIGRELNEYLVASRSGCGAGGKGKCVGAGAWLLARRVGMCGGVLSNRHVRWHKFALACGAETC